MTRKTLLIVAASALCLLGAVGVLGWTFWPEPPPSTADELYGVVLQPRGENPSEEDTERWVAMVADVAKRLPPHEFQKVVKQALQNPALRERVEAAFKKLTPEQRRRVMELIPQEQRVRMMTEGFEQFVRVFKAMPAFARKAALRQMHARGKRQRERRAKAGRHGRFTKERFVTDWLGKTTPRQRARFCKAMREMRTMLEEAGIRD